MPEMALAITLTLAMRPVGAFIFGLMADRYGRRLPLMIDLVFFSIVEVLSGLAPSYTTFLILRALFGIGMGGEWGVGASLAMEKVPRRLARPAVGPAAGGLRDRLSARGRAATSSSSRTGAGGRCSSSAALPALLAIFVRLQRQGVRSLAEDASTTSWSQPRPRHRRRTGSCSCTLALMMTMMNFVSHGTQDMYPTFLQNAARLHAARSVSYIAIIYNVGAILGGTRHRADYSDRVGRRRAMVTSLLLAIVAIPLWAYAPTTTLLVIGAFLLQFMVQGAWGVIPAHINELSPDSVRGFLPGFAYQCGVAVAGTVAYIEASSPTRFTYANAMALTAITVFTLAAIVVASGERSTASSSVQSARLTSLPQRHLDSGIPGFRIQVGGVAWILNSTPSVLVDRGPDA